MLGFSAGNSSRGIVVTVEGELDGACAAEFVRSLVDMLETSPPAMALSLDGLNYLDSRGLGAIITVFYRARERQSKFALIVRNPDIRRVLRITGIDRLIPLLEGDFDGAPGDALSRGITSPR